MIQADFYVLSAADTDSRYLFLGKLASKALQEGHRIYLHCEDEGHAQLLSERLWQAGPTLFLANQLATSDAQTTAPIQLGWQADHRPPVADMLINLASHTLTLAGFQRIAEIIIQQPEILTLTRARYRHCQQQGFTTRMHDMRQASS